VDEDESVEENDCDSHVNKANPLDVGAEADTSAPTKISG
jgi:hypothetical protein